jgi:hypothetical protein
VPLARARGGASQEGLVSLLGAERMRSHFVVAVAMGSALRAGTGPQWWVVDDGKAGRNQGGDFLPLNRPEEKDAVPLAGSLIVSLNKV